MKNYLLLAVFLVFPVVVFPQSKAVAKDGSVGHAPKKSQPKPIVLKKDIMPERFRCDSLDFWAENFFVRVCRSVSGKCVFIMVHSIDFRDYVYRREGAYYKKLPIPQNGENLFIRSVLPVTSQDGGSKLHIECSLREKPSELFSYEYDVVSKELKAIKSP